MSIYNLGDLHWTTDGHGFNIDHEGRSLVSFRFESQEEADAMHKAMRPIIAKAKSVVPFPR